MTIEEYNTLEIETDNTLDWFHKGIGILKQYTRKNIKVKDNILIYGDMSLLEKLTNNEIYTLKKYNWIINEEHKSFIHKLN